MTTKIGKEIIWFLYYNSDSSVKRLRGMNNRRNRSKKDITNNLGRLYNENYIQRVRSDRNRRRYDVIHYKLTRKGVNYAENLPSIREEMERKAEEYRLDAEEHYRRNR